MSASAPQSHSGNGVRLTAALRRLNSETSGSSLVELAMVFSFLAMPLLIGTADMATLVHASIEVSNAAQAAAQYGMQSTTNSVDTSGIVSAGQADAPDFGTGLTVTPTTYYACSSSVTGTRYTGTNAQSNATNACTGIYNHALEFIQVTTSATITPKVHLPGLPSSFALNGTAIQEVLQ